MPIRIQWEDEARGILRWDVYGEWTIEDLYSASAKTQVMLNTHPEYTRYYMLLVTSDDAVVPPNAISHSRNAMRMYSDPRKVYIRVGGNFIQRMITQVFLQLFGSTMGERFAYRDTLDEALELIDQMEAKRQQNDAST